MSSRSYHDAVWQSVPEDTPPVDLPLRRAFMLAGLAAAATRDGAAAPLRVLDVGCGEGRLTAAAVQAGYAAVGVDVAAEPLRRARERDAELDVRLVSADGEWPLADASFDAVWAGETIEHVADTTAWLSQVRRVLRSGGSLLLSTPAHGRLTMLALALSPRRMDAHFDPRPPGRQRCARGPDDAAGSAWWGSPSATARRSSTQGAVAPSEAISPRSAATAKNSRPSSERNQPSLTGCT